MFEDEFAFGFWWVRGLVEGEEGVVGGVARTDVGVEIEGFEVVGFEVGEGVEVEVGGVFLLMAGEGPEGSFLDNFRFGGFGVFGGGRGGG